MAMMGASAEDEERCLLAGYHLVDSDHDRPECPTEVEDSEPQPVLAGAHYIREPVIIRSQLDEHSPWL